MDRLEKLLEEIEKLFEKENTLFDEREKEIEKVRQEFELKIKTNKEERRKIQKSLLNASFFNLEKISNAIARIISEYEGERYAYNELRLDSDLNVCDEINCIAPCTLDLYDNKINRKNLMENKDVLIFPNVKDKVILFRFNNNSLVGIDFGRFTYLEDFFKFVINYRLSKGIDIFFEARLNDLVNSFLLLKSKEINERKEEREMQKKLILS